MKGIVCVQGTIQNIVDKKTFFTLNFYIFHFYDVYVSLSNNKVRNGQKEPNQTVQHKDRTKRYDKKRQKLHKILKKIKHNLRRNKSRKIVTAQCGQI